LGAATNSSNQEVAVALVRSAARTTHTFLRTTLSLWSMVKGGGGNLVGAAACGGADGGPVGGGGQRRWVAAW
jgi:hypothetical protein